MIHVARYVTQVELESVVIGPVKYIDILRREVEDQLRAKVSDLAEVEVTVQGGYPGPFDTCVCASVPLWREELEHLLAAIPHPELVEIRMARARKLLARFRPAQPGGV